MKFSYQHRIPLFFGTKVFAFDIVGYLDPLA